MAAVEQVGGQPRAAARRPSSQGMISQAAGYLAMAGVVFLIGLPLLWLLSAAFKETAEIYVVPATWLPNEPTLRNFPRAWNAAPFGMYYLEHDLRHRRQRHREADHGGDDRVRPGDAPIPGQDRSSSR